MPYADLDLEAGRKNGTVWVKLPNKHFDPEKGHKLYNRFLDELTRILNLEVAPPLKLSTEGKTYTLEKVARRG